METLIFPTLIGAAILLTLVIIHYLPTFTLLHRMLMYMTQHVLKPTRHRNDQASSVLDLVFTLDPNMVTDIEHLPPLGHSNHEVIVVVRLLQ